MLLGPIAIGSLWSGFAITDCTDRSGDPVVLYDKLEDRWLLSQFTTRGPIFYNCVAISQTGDPTGAYFRYAFSTGVNFQTIQSTGSGGICTSSPHANSDQLLSMVLVFTGSNGTRCSQEIRMPASSASSSTQQWCQLI